MKTILKFIILPSPFCELSVINKKYPITTGGKAKGRDTSKSNKNLPLNFFLANIQPIKIATGKLIIVAKREIFKVVDNMSKIVILSLESIRIKNICKF